MKNKPNLFAVLTSLIRLQIKRFADLTQLASLEAKLAGKSFIRILVLIYIMGFFLLSTWLGLLVILFVWLISLQVSWLMAAFVVTLLNFTTLIIILFTILKMKQNLFFPATRRQIANTSIKKVL